MSNEERKRRSTKTSSKPLKKLKGLDEVLIIDEDPLADEPVQKGILKNKSVFPCSQPVLGTPLRKKLHNILANWRPPIKNSQSVPKSSRRQNEEDKENMDISSCSSQVADLTTAQRSRKTDTSRDLVSGSSVGMDRENISRSSKSGAEASRSVTSLDFSGEDSGSSNRNKRENNNGSESPEGNDEGSKSKHNFCIPSKEKCSLESKSAEEEEEEKSVNSMMRSEVEVVVVVPDSINSPPHIINEGEMESVCKEPSKEEKQRHESSSIPDHNSENIVLEEQLDAATVASPAENPQQCTGGIVVSANSTSTRDHMKLNLRSPKQCQQNVVLGGADKTTVVHNDEPKRTEVLGQQVLLSNQPSTCIPSFNDIIALEQDECRLEIDAGRSFVEEENKAANTEALAQKGKFIRNLTDLPGRSVDTVKFPDCDASNGIGEEDGSHLSGNQQQQELKGKESSGGIEKQLIEDELCLTDSQFESIERNLALESSSSSTVASQVNNNNNNNNTTNNRWMSSSSSSTFSNPYNNAPRVPKMSPMEWVEQMRNDKKRLQGVVREISQLNAMLTRAIKEIWPTKK